MIGSKGFLYTYIIVLHPESTPVDAKNDTEAELVKALKESQVVTAGNTRLQAAWKGGEDNGLVNGDISALLQVIVVSLTFALATKGTVHFYQPVASFPVNLGIWWNEAPLVDNPSTGLIVGQFR